MISSDRDLIVDLSHEDCTAIVGGYTAMAVAASTSSAIGGQNFDLAVAAAVGLVHYPIGAHAEAVAVAQSA